MYSFKFCLLIIHPFLPILDEHPEKNPLFLKGLLEKRRAAMEHFYIFGYNFVFIFKKGKVSSQKTKGEGLKFDY